MPPCRAPLGCATVMALCLAAGSARADSACDKPRNGFDGLYCLNKIYQQSDADLNAAYAQLNTRLDPAGRGALRTGQIAWLQGRDQECSKQDPSGFYVNLACATRTTIERTRFLQDRYRECVSSGCLDSRLR